MKLHRSALFAIVSTVGCGEGRLDTSVGATSTIGPGGGRVESEGLTLVVPPGALGGEVRISLERRPVDDPAILAAVTFQPDGLRFAKPVRLYTPLGAQRTPGSPLVVLTLSAGGYVPEPDGDGRGPTASVGPDGRTAVATLEHFSTHALADTVEDRFSLVDMFSVPLEDGVDAPFLLYYPPVLSTVTLLSNGGSGHCSALGLNFEGLDDVRCRRARWGDSLRELVLAADLNLGEAYARWDENVTKGLEAAARVATGINLVRPDGRALDRDTLRFIREHILGQSQHANLRWISRGWDRLFDKLGNVADLGSLAVVLAAPVWHFFMQSPLYEAGLEERIHRLDALIASPAAATLRGDQAFVEAWSEIRPTLLAGVDNRFLRFVDVMVATESGVLIELPVTAGILGSAWLVSKLYGRRLGGLLGWSLEYSYDMASSAAAHTDAQMRTALLVTLILNLMPDEVTPEHVLDAPAIDNDAWNAAAEQASFLGAAELLYYRSMERLFAMEDQPWLNRLVQDVVAAEWCVEGDAVRPEADDCEGQTVHQRTLIADWAKLRGNARLEVIRELFALRLAVPDGPHAPPDEVPPVEPGTIDPGYPFAVRHATTDTPQGHAQRGVHDGNWDIDCTMGEAVGAIVGGIVTDQWQDGLGSGLANSYGNHICIFDPDSGVTFCHNHLQAGTLAVQVGCMVERGERIAGCGNSGTVFPLGGGDGTHLDVYAFNVDGGVLPLPDPAEWGPMPGLGESDCVGRPGPCGTPELTSPADGDQVDLPVLASWTPVSCGADPAENYRLQAAQSLPFRAACDGGIESQDDCRAAGVISIATDGATEFVLDDELGACQVWYLRVRAGHPGSADRGSAGGPFSVVRSFRTSGCAAACEPEACYNGAPDSEGVGMCRAGQRLCNADGQLGDCVGQRLPAPEVPCNGQDEDCDGSDARPEGCVCPEGAAANACGGCGPEPVEVCNGDDDDCDGSTDENLTNDCGGCGPEPVEVCNGEDDDCDGSTDEGLTNDCGGCGPEPVEVCNGEDDDCDGDADDGASCPGGAVCAGGQCVAACQPQSIVVDDCAVHLGQACPGFDIANLDGWWVRFRDSAGFTSGAQGGQFEAHATTDGPWDPNAHSAFATWTAGLQGPIVVEVHVPDPGAVDPTGVAGDCLDAWALSRQVPWRLYADGQPEVNPVTGFLDQVALGPGWHPLNAGSPVLAAADVAFRMTSHTGERCRTVLFDAVRFTRVCE